MWVFHMKIQLPSCLPFKFLYGDSDWSPGRGIWQWWIALSNSSTKQRQTPCWKHCDVAKRMAFQPSKKKQTTPKKIFPELLVANKFHVLLHLIDIWDGPNNSWESSHIKSLRWFCPRVFFLLPIGANQTESLPSLPWHLQGICQAGCFLQSGSDWHLFGHELY